MALRLFLIGHDNIGSRILFLRLRDAFPDATMELAITNGLYYRKSRMRSIVKLMREASFIFCASRAVELWRHRLRGDTLAAAAKNAGIPFFTTFDINGADAVARIRQFNPDLIVSLYTMHIYRAEILAVPRLAAITAHPSILPDYRGLETFFWAMANGEKTIGVSVFQLMPKIDVGPVYNQVVLPLAERTSMSRVYEQITVAGADLLVKSIREIRDGSAAPRAPQGRGRYFPMPTRAAMKDFWRRGHSLL